MDTQNTGKKPPIVLELIFEGPVCVSLRAFAHEEVQEESSREVAAKVSVVEEHGGGAIRNPALPMAGIAELRKLSRFSARERGERQRW